MCQSRAAWDPTQQHHMSTGMTSSQQDSPQAMSTEQALDPALLGEVVRLLKQQDQGLAEPEGLRHEGNHQQHAFKTLL
ncbi:unnamed protein product [Arctogadus glacialis]